MWPQGGLAWVDYCSLLAGLTNHGYKSTDNFLGRM